MLWNIISDSLENSENKDITKAVRPIRKGWFLKLNSSLPNKKENKYVSSHSWQRIRTWIG